VRRTLVVALALCLLAPAGASAKGGVIFDRYPDVQAVGSKMKFTVMLFNRRNVRPLVTFRDAKTHEVVRTRASRSDLNGIAYGSVALPTHGPWMTTISLNGRPVFEGDAEPFRVGVGLTQTIPSADAERRAADAGAAGSPSGDGRGSATDRGTSAWPWIALAALASAAAAFALHRRRRWGAA
jgi:hypothetical protein